MRTEVIDGVVVRPLRNGETAVVQTVFDRLGPRSRLLRFGGAKNVLSASELELLALVDADHHVLVAYVGGEPVGIARLVREGRGADVAVEVADDFQRRGIGTILMSRLVGDARAAGIEELHADVAPENTISRRLMQRLAVSLAPSSPARAA